MKRIIELTFHNKLEDVRHGHRFPKVGLVMDGTEMLVFTIVSDKYTREVMDIAQLQERLETLFGSLRWEKVRDVPCRTQELYGWKQMLIGAGVTDQAHVNSVLDRHITRWEVEVEST